MGMLIEFYTGDTKKIASAWKRSDFDTLANKDIVYSQADLSFHLSPQAIDELVRAGCRLLGRPPMTLEHAIQKTLLLKPAADPEQGIHEMADAFTALFADIQPDQAGTLYQMWMAQLPEPDAPRRPPALQRFRSKAEDLIAGAILWPVLIAALAGYWLFSPSFRRARRENKAKREAEQNQPATVAEATLEDAVADLIVTCKTARERGTKVLYAWSI